MSFPLHQELVDYIIDFLFDDDESLAECTLVCKDWLSSSHYHLFRELEFDLDEDIDFEDFPSRATPYVREVILQSSVSDLQNSVAIPIVVELFPRLRSLCLDSFIWEPLIPLPQVSTEFSELELYGCVFHGVDDFAACIRTWPRLNKL